MLLQPQHYRQALFTSVQNDYDNLSVGILNGSHIQLIRILLKAIFGTGFDKVGKMKNASESAGAAVPCDGDHTKTVHGRGSP
ncbi:MAG: hypothetical protein ACLURV_15235 [Gallintestinimicrobium sp.]